MSGFSLYIPGATLIILGLLVIMFPMLLVALFSAGLMLIGIIAISVANRLRRSPNDAHWNVVWDRVDRNAREWPQRVFLYRRW
jgi:hypothetical protein